MESRFLFSYVIIRCIINESCDCLNNSRIKQIYEWVFSSLCVPQHITNPRKAKGQQDLVINNPLSQDEGVRLRLRSYP